MSVREAVLTVRQVVESQHRDFRPQRADVDEWRLVADWNGRNYTLYFERLSEITLWSDRRGNFHFVRMRDRASGSLYRVWVRNAQIDDAHRLIDALYTLQRYAAEHDPGEAQRQRDSEERLRRLRELREEMEGIRREQDEERQRRELDVEPENPEAVE